jgi:hypothetical protein
MSLRLTAAAIALAAGLGVTQGAYASEASNGLSANGLSANGLSANGLVINGLATNGTRSDSAELMAVILPDGSRITIE